MNTASNPQTSQQPHNIRIFHSSLLLKETWAPGSDDPGVISIADWKFTVKFTELTLRDYMSHKFYDLTFTPSVKAAQEHYGTRKNYARFEGGEPDFHGLTDAEIDFIEQRDGFYMATVGETGQPYIQFRGGPQGFLKVLDDRTLGYADFRGNLQYISVGNLAASSKAALFLMDYPNQRRLKILVRVEVKDAKHEPDLIEKLKMPDYKAKIERAMILRVDAFDWNCPQHITPRYTMAEIEQMTRPFRDQIEKLEKEIEVLAIRLAEKVKESS